MALVVLNQLLQRTGGTWPSDALHDWQQPAARTAQGASRTYQQAFELLGFRDVNPVVLLHHLDVLHFLVEPATGCKDVQENARSCSGPVRPGSSHSLNADGKALGLSRPLSDQVGAADVGLQQVVRLLPLHVPCEPEPEVLRPVLSTPRNPREAPAPPRAAPCFQSKSPPRVLLPSSNGVF